MTWHNRTWRRKANSRALQHEGLQCYLSYRDQSQERGPRASCSCLMFLLNLMALGFFLPVGLELSQRTQNVLYE